MTGLLTKKQLSEAIGVSIPTIDRNMKRGMPYYKIGGFSVRFDLQEVMEWIKKGE